jgi:hypothetical protein
MTRESSLTREKTRSQVPNENLGHTLLIFESFFCIAILTSKIKIISMELFKKTSSRINIFYFNLQLLVGRLHRLLDTYLCTQVPKTGY